MNKNDSHALPVQSSHGVRPTTDATRNQTLEAEDHNIWGRKK